jgi:hypothetical protein
VDNDMATLTEKFTISQPPSTAWDEAFSRVESYLSAHHLESRVLLNRLATTIVREARQAAESTPGVAPVALAMQTAEAKMGAWYHRVLQDGDPEDERFRARGRLALVMAGVPVLWPEYFLSDETPPPELVAAMKATYLEAGPEVVFTNMAPRAIEFPLVRAADETWETFRRLPALRATAGWIAIIGLLGAVWVVSH